MRGISSGCEIHSAREGRRHTNCIKYKPSAMPLESKKKVIFFKNFKKTFKKKLKQKNPREKK
jgi:hypothetical protein